MILPLAAPAAVAPGRPVGQLGFGTAEIANLYRPITEAQAQATLQAAWDAGLTLFDTAPGYGAGLGELRLGAFLRGYPREAYTLATKVGRCLVPARGAPHPGVFAAPLPFVGHFDYGYDGIMRSFEQSTLRLGITRFDLLFVHDLDRRNHGDGFDHHYARLFDSGLRALTELQRAGDVGRVGVAVNESDVGVRMLGDGNFDLALLASRYTLLEQGALDAFLPEAARRRLPVLAAGVFNSGILASVVEDAGTYDYQDASPAIRARVAALRAVCSAHGVSLAAASLRFVLAHPAIACVLVGTSRPERVAETAALPDTSIPVAFWDALRTERLIAPGAPTPP